MQVTPTGNTDTIPREEPDADKEVIDLRKAAGLARVFLSDPSQVIEPIEESVSAELQIMTPELFYDHYKQARQQHLDGRDPQDLSAADAVTVVMESVGDVTQEPGALEWTLRGFALPEQYAKSDRQGEVIIAPENQPFAKEIIKAWVLNANRVKQSGTVEPKGGRLQTSLSSFGRNMTDALVATGTTYKDLGLNERGTVDHHALLQGRLEDLGDTGVQAIEASLLQDVSSW